MLYFFLQLHKILLCLNSLWCCVNLTNFLVFLYNGQYLHVYERLCGMRTAHVKGRALREVGDKKCLLLFYQMSLVPKCSHLDNLIIVTQLLPRSFLGILLP